jgi:phage-related protein
MSFLGTIVDTFIASVQNIIDFIMSLLSQVSNFILALFTALDSILTLIYSLFSILEFLVSLLFNPYLLLSFILGSSLFYAAFTASTRKDMIIKLGVFWKYTIETTVKVLHAIYEMVVKLIVGLIDMI